MYTPEQILKIAQNLQPQLHELLPDDRATAIAPQLTELIAKANAGEPVTQEILDLLDNQPELQSYLAIATSKQVPAPPGNSAPIPASEDIPFKGMPTPEPPKTDTPKQK
jgi:hypothetical protein